MRPLNYNPSDADSIISYAKKLVGKKLSDFTEILESQLNDDSGNKGRFGQTLEEHYFGYKANSNSEPDFPEAGLELKSSPLKVVRKNNLVAKERLVLNIINYHDIVDENFENSAFYKKNAHLLLVFYKHEKDVQSLELTILLVGDWRFPEQDLEIIIQDWHTIRDKVTNGLAHEISEGDTFYLGACTKGSNASSLRGQPFSDILAMQRAYSLKAGYLNHVIATLGRGRKEKFGKLLDGRKVTQKVSIEELVIQKLSSFYGKSTNEIEFELGLSYKKRPKHYYHLLTKAMLGFSADVEIEEFVKAGIIIKTVKVEEEGKIIESVSFKHFHFTDLVSTPWEESEIKNIVESKFLFLFFKEQKGQLRFNKAKFWNMAYEDRKEYEKVYYRTVEVLKNGDIVNRVGKEKSGKLIYHNNFPKISESHVAHVRPHGKDRNDTLPLPVNDRLTGKSSYTKQSFWLNAGFVYDKIYK